MAVNHEDKAKENVNSIFRVLHNLIKSNVQDGEHCFKLLKTLTDTQFAVGNSTNVQYAVKRLVRGLAAPRCETQSACFAGLCAVLRHSPVPLEEIFGFVDKEFKKQDQVKSTVCSGLVLMCGAIVESGMYNTLDIKDKQLVVDRLLNYGQAKNYLSFASYSILTLIVVKSSASEFKKLWLHVKDKLQNEVSNLNVDHMYFLLVALEKALQVLEKFIASVFGSVNVFLEKALSLSLNVKHEHPIVETLAKFLIKKEDLLVEAWDKQLSKGVDGAKDFNMLLLFSSIVKNLEKADRIPELLTSNTVRMLIKVLTKRPNKKQDGEASAKNMGRVYSKGKEVITDLQNLLKKEEVGDDLRLEVIQKLLFYPGSVKFDVITGTKCVQELIAALDAKHAKKLSKTLHKIVNNEKKKKVNESGVEEPWHSKERQQVIQMCVKMLNHAKLSKDTNWKLSEIQFLFDVAFLGGRELSADFQSFAKDSFYKATEVGMNSLDDLVSLLANLLQYINNHVKEGAVVLNEKQAAQWKQANKIVLQGTNTNKSLVVMHLLLMHMGLQLLRNDEQVGTAIEDLVTCCKHLQGTGDSENDIHWTEVTIDILLSLLSKDDRLWRHVVHCIFPHIVNFITPTGLNQIIEALDPLSEKNILSHVDSDNDDDEDEDEKEEESEVEEDESEDNSMSEEEKVSDKLRMAVRDALGYSAALTDDESVDMDNMTETEEKKLNISLGSVFRQFRSNKGKAKKKQSKEDEAQVHFRNRVLDLINIYLNNNPSMSGCLDLILPLFSLLEAAIKDHHLKPFQNRLESTLKKLSEVKKFRDMENVDGALLVSTFKAVVQREDVSGLLFVEMTPRISDICTFLVRCSMQIEDTAAEVLFVKEYTALLQSYFGAGDTRLPFSLFLSVLRMVWPGNWKLVSTLYEIVANEKLRFMKKIKAVDLLHVFYTNDRLHVAASKKDAKILSKAEVQFTERLLPELHNTTLRRELLIKLLVLIKTAYNSSVKYRSGKSTESWKQIVQALNRMESAVGHAKAREHLVVFSKLFGVEPPAAAKKPEQNNKKKPIPEITNGQTEESPLKKNKGTKTENEETEESKKKKKKSKNTGLKKESKDLRLAISSQGLESVTFSSLKYNAFEEKEEGVKEKKRKIKDVNGDVKPKKKKLVN